MEFSSTYPVWNIILFLFGLYLLVKGSDLFIDSATYIAEYYHISKFIIGLTLVSIGTSLPEITTDIYAALMSEADIAIGTIVGSNIVNIALVLGLGAVLMKNIPVTKTILYRDGNMLIFTYFLFFMLCQFGDGSVHILNRVEGLFLFFVFGGYIGFLFFNRKEIENPEEKKPHDYKRRTMPKAWIFLVFGLIMVISGSKFMVDNVVWCADFFNLSKVFIAVIIVAFGTSLPELAVTLSSVKKKQHSMALGNIIGSCIFNILLGLGCAALIRPMPVEMGISTVQIPIMCIIGGCLFFFMKTGMKLTRSEGVILLLIYGVLISYNIYTVI